MAKKQRTVVNFVLDETGSMESVRSATISGFNEYLDTLLKEKGEVLFTLTQFNSFKVEVVHQAVPIKNVPRLNVDTYKPNGMTPLYDAIAQTIHATEEAVKGMKSKPSVLCVIQTDGEENASKEYNRERLFNLIKSKEAEGWTFAYVGAGQDAWLVAESIGVPAASALSYNQADPQTAFRRIGHATADYMAKGAVPSKRFFQDNG